MVRTVAGVERDGDLDTVIVAHEWGHYLHHRLSSCGTQQCGAMSEGWADFNGLLTILRATDDPHRTYSVGIYAAASFGDAYFGIRRAPYSVDFSKNGFTFTHIQQSAVLPTTFPIAFGGSNEEVHNAGEIWCAMMWESFVALYDAHGYDLARRVVSDYVVAGLLLAPVDATFTETRDALLTATAAIDTADAVRMAQAFARRGAGSCAVSPDRTSTTLDGVVESFSVTGQLALGAVSLDDDSSCDDDGILDAGEAGTLSVEVVNTGAGPLSATTVTVTSSTTGVTVGGTVSVPTIAPFSSTVVSVPVSLASSVTGRTTMAFSIQLNDSGACNGGVTGTASIRGNYDSIPGASATDDVESESTVWTRTGNDASQVWSRQSVAGQTIVWHGNDTGAVTDTQLMSPPLAVGSAAFSLTFQTRYSFETSQGKNWDGGVIEVSQDNGATWADAATLGTVAYNGTINDTAGNPLGGRQGFVKSNTGYPNRVTTTVAFGTSLANRTIRLRFRIGTDEAAGDYGWDVDNLAFTGLTTTPFAVLADENGTCNPPPPPIDAGPVDAPPPPPIDAAPIDAPPPPIDAGPIDAPPPPPIDAAPIDAPPGTIDAAVPDAAAPPIDAPAGGNDAATTPDAGDGGGGGGGCGCQTGGSPAGALAPLAALAFVLRRRRRA